MKHSNKPARRLFTRREALAMTAGLGAAAALGISPAGAQTATTKPVLARPIPRTREADGGTQFQAFLLKESRKVQRPLRAFVWLCRGRWRAREQQFSTHAIDLGCAEAHIRHCFQGGEHRQPPVGSIGLTAGPSQDHLRQGSMVPACRARPHPRRRPLNIPVHQTALASKHARQPFPGSRAPVSHPAFSLPATRDSPRRLPQTLA